jgi:hypothetical protein
MSSVTWDQNKDKLYSMKEQGQELSLLLWKSYSTILIIEFRSVLVLILWSKNTVKIMSTKQLAKSNSFYRLFVDKITRDNWEKENG